MRSKKMTKKKEEKLSNCEVILEKIEGLQSTFDLKLETFDLKLNSFIKECKNKLKHYDEMNEKNFKEIKSEFNPPFEKVKRDINSAFNEIRMLKEAVAGVKIKRYDTITHFIFKVLTVVTAACLTAYVVRRLIG